MRNIYQWFLFLILTVPVAVFAQAAPEEPGDGAMDGNAGYSAGWWFWTILLLAVVALIVWWAVRAGTAGKRTTTTTPPRGGRGPGVQGGT